MSEEEEQLIQRAIRQIYSFKEGCIQRVASYYDPQEALEAASLPRQDS